MKGVSLIQSVRVVRRSLRNYITDKPLAISFEVTHSCTCNCLHCDRGGKTEEKNCLSQQTMQLWYHHYVLL
jgi:MoaA/NifB/PqqE/SkfB family radical SAM enzyme